MITQDIAAAPLANGNASAKAAVACLTEAGIVDADSETQIFGLSSFLLGSSNAHSGRVSRLGAQCTDKHKYSNHDRTSSLQGCELSRMW